MYDAEAALKEGASDLGFDLSTGGLPHKREFARLVSARKTAKVMAETELHADDVARAHGVPVTLLPCDWTSILAECEKKYGSHISDDRLPAQSMFESFTEKMADGTFKAEPVFYVVILFEEEQQELKQSPNQLGSTTCDLIPGSLSRPSGGISVQSQPTRRVSG